MRKSIVGLLLTLAPAIWAQSADRVVPAPPSQNNEGLVAKALGILAPSDPTPLTERQRFHDYVMSTVGPLPILSEAASAGLGQWRDSPHEWGQGGSGYAKRFANDMAYNGVRTTISYGVSALLHEDNRYFASGKQSVMGRLMYALASPVMARRGGRTTLSFSSLSGIAGASGISLAWAPPSWQGADNYGINFGLTYAGIAGLNVAREFVPGIIRHFRE